jgi:carbon starvation protein
MAFSTFVFDTLAAATRLGRYLLEEFVGLRAFASTVVTAAVPLCFVLLAGSGAWKAYWTLFGTSNLLLAALSLLGVTVWLKRTGRAWRFALVPTVLVSAVTWDALVLQIGEAFLSATAVQLANGAVSVVLLGLAVSVTVAGTRALVRPAPVLPSTGAVA